MINNKTKDMIQQFKYGIETSTTPLKKSRECPFPRTISGLKEKYGGHFTHTPPFATLGILNIENGHCPGAPVLLNGCRSTTGIVFHAECVCGNFHTSGFREIDDVKSEWLRMCYRFGEEEEGRKWIRDHQNNS